jgi:hypothetical protein
MDSYERQETVHKRGITVDFIELDRLLKSVVLTKDADGEYSPSALRDHFSKHGKLQLLDDINALAPSSYKTDMIKKPNKLTPYVAMFYKHTRNIAYSAWARETDSYHYVFGKDIADLLLNWDELDTDSINITPISNWEDLKRYFAKGANRAAALKAIIDNKAWIARSPVKYQICNYKNPDAPPATALTAEKALEIVNGFLNKEGTFSNLTSEQKDALALVMQDKAELGNGVKATRLTPNIAYLLKVKYNIAYSAWGIEHPYHAVLFGPVLSRLIKGEFSFSEDPIKATDVTGLSGRDIMYYKFKDLLGNDYEDNERHVYQVQLMILTQSHLASEVQRRPGIDVLDYHNVDNVPGYDGDVNTITPQRVSAAAPEGFRYKKSGKEEDTWYKIDIATGAVVEKYTTAQFRAMQNSH